MLIEKLKALVDNISIEIKSDIHVPVDMLSMYLMSKKKETHKSRCLKIIVYAS